MELLRGVSGQMELRESRVIDVGQKLTNLVGAGKDPAKAGMGETRIPAKFRFRRFFEHDHFRGAGLFCRHGGLKGGAATADDDHWDVFSSHGSCLPNNKNPQSESRNLS